MTDSDFAALAEKADTLAEQGEWGELYAALAPEESKLYSRPHMAYRFGEALYHTARFDRLQSFAGKLEESARDSADPRTMMKALNLAFIARFEQGDVTAARHKGEALLELAEAEDDDEILAKSANNMGLVYSLEGDWSQAISHFQLALPLYERTGQARGLAQTHHNLGNAYRYLERLDDSEESYRKASELAQGIGYPFMAAMATVGRADIKRLQERHDMARGLAERGIARARSVGDPVSEADGLRVRALIRASGEERDDTALDDLRRARELADDANASLLVAEIDKNAGVVLMDLGRLDEARKHLESAVSTFENQGARMEADRARRHIEKLESRDR